VADRVAGDAHRNVARAGTRLSLVALVPCPPLLIDDLGDPRRFHHMLRVFKPSSPMNIGTWTLVGYSGMVGASVLREWLRDRGQPPEDQPGAKGILVRRWLGWHDVLGIPLAIGIAGYTGVLLSCTSNPLWCRNPWLGPLFSASAMSTGAEAISLALDCTSKSSDGLEASQRVLQRIDTTAHLAEAACAGGFQRYAGEQAQPLKQGSVRQVHRLALGGLVGSEVLKLLPVGRRLRKPVRMAAAALGLAAGFALRWSMIYGGKEAADNPHLARANSRPQS
jgi:formate-dependent nitrite reductase membrane component NrfD